METKAQRSHQKSQQLYYNQSPHTSLHTPTIYLFNIHFNIIIHLHTGVTNGFLHIVLQPTLHIYGIYSISMRDTCSIFLAFLNNLLYGKGFLEYFVVFIKSNVRHRVYKIYRLNPILIQFNTPCSSKIHFSITLPYMSSSLKWTLSLE